MLVRVRCAASSFPLHRACSRASPSENRPLQPGSRCTGPSAFRGLLGSSSLHRTSLRTIVRHRHAAPGAGFARFHLEGICSKVGAVFEEEKTMSIQRINAGPRMSSAVVHGNTVYLAGLTADDTKADVKGQTKQILDKIDKFLKEAGTDKSKILSANIWLTDIGTWSQMNEVWDAWVSPGNTPARATVEAKLANPALKVEIMVQAALS